MRLRRPRIGCLQPDHQHRLGAYERLFPEGAWQRDNPIMLESDTAKLLMQEYTNLPGGLVRFKPCTLIFVPDGEASAADSRHRVMVLEAPQATMRFDGAVDLSRMKIGRLQGGILEGEITVKGAATRPDGSDELYAVTHDVQLVGNQLFTSRYEDGRWIASPNDVQFRFGPNQGHGHGMQIDLIAAADGKQRNFNFTGVQSVQLLQDVEMHLQPGSSGRTSGPAANPALSNSQSPVDIRCQGPFEFDMVANLATFRKQVDVLRANPNGSSDQINCELLSVGFAPREQNEAAAAGANPPQASPRKTVPGRQPLEARKIEARGNPVIVRTPSSGGEVRGEYLQYDVVSGNLRMESQTGAVQINSPQLRGQVSRLEAAFHEGTSDAASSSSAAAQPTDRSEQPAGANNTPQQHYEIAASVLEVSFVTVKGASKLEQVQAAGNVWFAQSPAAAGEPRPLEIRGEQLQVLHADTQAQMTVSGQPAQVLAQGLTMFGRTVQMDQATNRLWIDGTGRLVIEETAAPPAAAATSMADNSSMNLWSGSGPTTVDWQGSMKFDGQLARFERGVVGTQGTQTLHCEVLEATLANRIDFRAGRPQERPQTGVCFLPGRSAVGKSRIQGSCRVGSRSDVSARSEGQSHQWRFSAPGPGRMKSWRLGPPPNQALIPGQAAATGGAAAQQVVPAAQENKAGQDQINFVDVQYQNGLTGNALRREFTFHDQVRSISGPVKTWDGQLDADNPAPGAMLLTCNQLTLYEVGPRGESRSALNLKAEGNAVVESQRLEGDLFRAWANEMSFAQEKDLIMLKGDGRSDAQLFRQVSRRRTADENGGADDSLLAIDTAGGSE